MALPKIGPPTIKTRKYIPKPYVKISGKIGRHSPQTPQTRKLPQDSTKSYKNLTPPAK
jgi:hypothetical protein